MSGLLSLAKFKQLNPETEFSDAEIQFGLNAAQEIAESLSGMRFGSSVSATADQGSNIYKLTIEGGRYFTGDQVRAIASAEASDPAPASLLTVIEAGADFITAEITDASFNIGKVLPVLVHEGRAVAFKVRCPARPIYTVESVKTKASDNTLWSASSGVTTLASTAYEVFREMDIPTGVRVQATKVPYAIERGEFLIKHRVTQALSGIQVTYSCGFNIQVPADLVMAASQLVQSIVTGMQKGVFSSESLEYYSYQQMDHAQLSMLPTSAVAVFRRYGRY